MRGSGSTLAERRCGGQAGLSDSPESASRPAAAVVIPGTDSMERGPQPTSCGLRQTSLPKAGSFSRPASDQAAPIAPTGRGARRGAPTRSRPPTIRRAVGARPSEWRGRTRRGSASPRMAASRGGSRVSGPGRACAGPVDRSGNRGRSDRAARLRPARWAWRVRGPRPVPPSSGGRGSGGQRLSGQSCGGARPPAAVAVGKPAPASQSPPSARPRDGG